MEELTLMKREPQWSVFFLCVGTAALAFLVSVSSAAAQSDDDRNGQNNNGRGDDDDRAFAVRQGPWNQHGQLPCTACTNRRGRFSSRLLSISARAHPERPDNRVGEGSPRDSRDRAGSNGASGRVGAAHAHQPKPDARWQRCASGAGPREAHQLRRESVCLQKRGMCLLSHAVRRFFGPYTVGEQDGGSLPRLIPFPFRQTEN